MKKSLSVILAVIFVIGVCFSTPFTIISRASTAVDGLTFELNDNGKSYYVSGYSESVSDELVIPSTYNDLPVTSIGSHAFEDCIALKSVIIPDSVTSIGDYAFYSCSVLTSVTIPDSVTTIGEGAFYYCVALTSVTIPDNVTNIGESAFSYCYDLENVTLGNGITGLSNLMFAGCSSLTSITIPDSVTTIGGGAFYECIKLANVTIPDNVTTIGEAAFYYCRELTSLILPNNITNIGDDAFANCSQELVFFINNNDYLIEYLEKNNLNYTFKSPLVFELNYDGESYYVSDCDTSVSGELVIPSTYNDLPVTSIGNEAFKECISLTSVIISDGVKSIGDYAFNDCVSLTSVTIPDGLTSIGEGAFYHCPVLTSIAIPDSVTNIGESAFYYCYDLENVTIGNDITSISDFMFAECISLTSITIPDNVTSIGAGAFYECIKLANVTIPNNVTTIGEAAFYYCRELTSLILPNNITNIGDDAFANCSQELVLFINNNDYLIEYLEKNNLNYTFKSPLVFELNDDGESYYVSDCDTSVSGELVIPSIYNDLSVTSIGNEAFKECISLTSITIPNTVTSVGENAFAKCTQLKKVNISDLENWCNIEFASDYANPLSNGAGLYLDGKIIRNLILPESLTEVKDYTFYGNKFLKSVKLPDTIEKIGASAFAGCRNIDLVVMSKNITDIGANAFDGCSSLESVVIPKTLKNVGYGAFHPNDGLKYVFYEGSVSDWNNIVMDEDNFTGRNLVIHYNSTGHTYMEVVNKPIFDGVESTREEICTVCAHVGKVEKIEFMNEYLAGVTTFGVALDKQTKYLSTNLCASQDLSETIAVIDGYTLNTIPNSFNFYGTGSKVQVLDDNGVQVDEYTLIVRGDVNGDSVCDVLDLMLIELARTNNRNLDGVYLTAGDLAENGVIDDSDFNAIVNKAIGI